MKKRINLAVAAAIVAGMTVTACGGSTTAQDGINIGICQLVTHDALDAATQGFMDAVQEAIPDVTFDLQNAAGDAATCATIANSFVSSGVDLILANATPSLAASSAATVDIPILGTSIAEYSVALGLEDFDGTVGGNVSGTTHIAPMDQQVDMLMELFPEAQTVGLLYCSAEVNSQYQVDTIKVILEEQGLAYEVFGFSDSNDLAAITQSAVESVDVIFVPTDNVVASNAGVINNIARPAGVPVIGGDEGITSACGVAALTVDFYELGITTGNMAIEILQNGGDISTMAISPAEEFIYIYNQDIASELGIEIPDGYAAIN